jgi:hypothetical protein
VGAAPLSDDLLDGQALAAGAVKFNDLDNVGRQVKIGEQLLRPIVIIDSSQTYSDRSPLLLALLGKRQNQIADCTNAVLPVMISASAGVYHRESEASIAPCCFASAAENNTSVPHAVLILYFFANS